MYIINYHNGVKWECDGTLEEAKKMADDGAAYTQCSITIDNEAGEQVAGRSWWGVPYDPNETEDEEDEVIQFGDYGHYGAWYEGCNPLLYTSWRMV